MLRSLRRCCDVLQPQLRAFSGIPIIDVASLVDPTASVDAKQRTGEELHEACQHVGFFYVRSHGVPEDEARGVREHARKWFQLPDNVKRQIAISPERHYRGYQQLGANVTRYGEHFQRDWHEAIDLYREVPRDQADVPDSLRIRDSALHGSNQWPDSSPDFSAALRQYLARMDVLGAAIMRGIALGLGLRERFFAEQDRGEPYWVMRVIHYPPLPQISDVSGDAGTAAKVFAGEEVSRATQLSCGEHTDYGLLTIVNQDDHIAALQVKSATGAWVTAAPVPGAFVCNIGDMMRTWTNGLYRPTLHRVLNADATRSRVSMPYFYEPGFDTLVTPQLGLRGSSLPAVVPARHYGSHLESKVFSNFEL